MAFGYTRRELFKYAPDRPDYTYYSSSGQQPQVTPYSSQARRAGYFVGGAAASIGALSLVNKLGYNPWDPIYAGVRTIEEFSPGKIFRTFQVGNFLSQFTTEGLKRLDIPASAINTRSPWFQDLLHRGLYRGNLPAAAAATQVGLRFENGTLFAGEHIVLRNARKMLSTGNPNLATAYSRATGFHLPNISDQLRFSLGEGTQDIFFTGGETKARAIFNQVHGLLGEWTVARANRLAEAPFGMEPFTTGLSRVQKGWESLFGTRLTLAVESGTPLQTFGRMGIKWGGIVTAAYLGYQTADWAVRNTGLFNSTVFDQGITAGIASIGAKANLTTAGIADFLPGVRAYQKKQEELAPGSTSLLKLAAFPATGALAGGTAFYLSGVINRPRAIRELMATKGLSYTQALPLAEAHWLENTGSVIQHNPLTRTLTEKFGEHIPFFGKITRGKAFAIAGIGLFTLPIIPFLPGALIPGKSKEELERLYSGEEEVPVRKGRFWEMGRTPYEGGKIEYFRPHWYARMMQRSFSKSMYDGDPNPIVQWIKENFTYGMEREHYRDRPYPITGRPFEDIPVVGPILASTIGRLIKPSLLMHEREWMQGDSYNSQAAVSRIPGRLGEYSPEETDIGKGTPIDPGTIRQVAGEQLYRIQELSGLTGFIAETLKEQITGEGQFFNQEEILQSANRMYGAERSFWDLNMGGGIFTNELFRRWFPHRRREIDEYNPIRNTMPSWLPGPGERSQDFLHGDPFVKVQEGEVRLPGAGYAARFPELEGVNPEDYPLIHKYKILSDIAPYAERTKIYEKELAGLARNEQLTPSELTLFEQTKKQNSQKKENKQFYDFDVIAGSSDIELPESIGANQSRSVVAALNRLLATKREEKIGPAKSIIGGYWQSVTTALQNPFEALTPLAPGSKLLNMKTALQDYKQTQIYGPDIAFWQHPVENFVLPFFRELGDLFNIKNIPENVQKKRSIDEYFDVLQYVKNKRLAEISKQQGAEEVSGAYERKADETTIGINPYTRDYSSLFRSIPRSERDYFGEFVSAKTQEDREEILRLAPPNMRRIYAAQWEQQYASVIKQAVDRDLIPSDVKEQAEAELRQIYDRRQTEGFPVNEDLLSRFQDEREEYEAYPDWFRRAVLIPGIVGEEGLPGPDWVGWSPQIDLDEVKLKVVKNEGMDIHDFNLWHADERSAAGKPYLDQVSEDLITTVIEHENRTPQQVQTEVRKILSELGIGSEAQVMVYEVPSDKEHIEIDIESSELRDRDIRSAVASRVNDLG